MCLKELLVNIIEMEEIIGKKVDPSLMKQVLETCPIDYELPILIEIPSPDHPRTQYEKDVDQAERFD